MNQETRLAVDGMKNQLLPALPMMRSGDAALPVNGTRIVIPLDGREIEIVFYKAAQEKAPLWIAFHGGGFLFGCNATDNAMWTKLRDTFGVNLVSVGYRKTPEFRWPAPVEDAYEVTRYLLSHEAEFGFNKNHVSVFGCSAGANIAASVCIYAKQQGQFPFEKQILIYPYLDLDTEPDLKGEGNLVGPIMYLFKELYVDETNARNITCSPVFSQTEDLEGLPETILITAGGDALCAEGERYGALLESANVRVHKKRMENMPHGFFEHGLGDEISNVAADEIEKPLLENGTLQKNAQEAVQFIRDCLR